MKCIFNKKDSFKVVVPISRSSFLWKNYEWTFLRRVHNTCRRGPHLCPCSPTLPKNKLVERTSGVGGPSYLLSMSTRLYYFLGNRQNSSLFIILALRKINIYLCSISKICIIINIYQEFLYSFPQEYNSCNYTYTGDKTL